MLKKNFLNVLDRLIANKQTITSHQGKTLMTRVMAFLLDAPDPMTQNINNMKI